MDERPVDMWEDRIEFTATLTPGGVPYIEDWAYDWAKAWAKYRGRPLISTSGDFETTCFHFEPPCMSDDEMDDFEGDIDLSLTKLLDRISN